MTASAPGSPQLPLKTLRVRCDDAARFRGALATRLALKGIFVVSEPPEPVGTHVRLRIERIGSADFASGLGVVVRQGQKRQRDGVFIQLQQLDAEGLQFMVPPVLEPAPRAPAQDPEVWANKSAPTPPPRTHTHNSPTPVQRKRTDPAADRATRVHAYDAAELRRALDPDRWAGGLEPFERLGDYQLLERRGQGGMAEVYAARRLLANGVDQLVALKLVLPEMTGSEEFGRLFLNEARVSATLEHPNVVAVSDVGEEAGRPYLAMEYVRGRSLGEVLQALRRRALTPSVAMGVQVAIQLCRALEYLHGKKDLDGTPLRLVHRDVSPGNLLVSQRGLVKLVDLGVAATEVGFDTADLIVGKHAYMPPEQVRGEAPSPAWDVYAAGVVLHEMLTLERLFDGDTDEVLHLHPGKQLPPSASNPKVPPELDRIVLWATDRDGARRAPSAQQLRLALEGVARAVGPFDMQALMEELFGPDLQAEERRLEALMLDARQRSPTSSSGLTPWSFKRTRLRRMLAASAPGRFLSQRRKVAVGALALLLGVLGAGGFALHRSAQSARALERALAEFDQSVAAGRLTGPTAHDAVDQLRAASALAPADPRVAGRRKLLADLFEELATAAGGREDLAEALAHLRAAFDTDPSRPGLQERLRELEQQMRERPRRSEVTP